MNRFLPEFFTGLSPAQKKAAAFVLFAISIILVYVQTIGFAYCVDDQYYLWLYIEEGSSLVEYAASLRSRFWGEQFRPVTFASILAEALIFGKDPAVHHTFNLLYYLVLCGLVFFTMEKFFRRQGPVSFYIALLTALLFLVHPSHANVVSSIKNREVVLGLGFGLMAMYSWWVYLDRGKSRWVLASGFFLLLGIFSKMDVASFLVVIPVSGFLYTGEFRWKAEGKRVLVFLVGVVGLYYMVLDQVAMPDVGEFFMTDFENPLAGEKMSLLEWIPYSSYILSIYWKFMIWPVGYYFYFGYDQLEIVNYWNLQTALSFMAHAGMMAAMIYLFIKKKYKYLLGPVIFFLAILPFATAIVSGIVSVRYSFIASLGFCLVVAQLLVQVYQRTRGTKLRPVFIIMVVALLGLSAFFARSRSMDWKDLYTLYAADLPHLERSVNANRMAGQYYFFEAQRMEAGSEQTDLLERSLVHADKALKVYPKETTVLDFKAKCLHMLGRRQESLAAWEALVAADRTNSANLSAAAYYAKTIGEYNIAIEYFEEIVALEDGGIDAYIELTQLYNHLGLYDQAFRLNDDLKELGSEYDALLNDGDTYLALKDTAKALVMYYRALKINPSQDIAADVLKISESAGYEQMSDSLRVFLLN